MKAMEYCDGRKLDRMAVDSCPCGEKKPRQKTEMSSPVLTRDGKEDEK